MKAITSWRDFAKQGTWFRCSCGAECFVSDCTVAKVDIMVFNHECLKKIEKKPAAKGERHE